MGPRALQAVIEHPNMALAGLYVYSDAVPCVCAASPATRTTVDLPQIIADLSDR